MSGKSAMELPWNDRYPVNGAGSSGEPDIDREPVVWTVYRKQPDGTYKSIGEEIDGVFHAIDK